MLVLSHKEGESIVIDGRIEVTVLLSKKGKIRLGIVAPPAMTIDRSEVHERRQEFAAATPLELIAN